MTNIKYEGNNYNKYRPTYPKKLYEIIYEFHDKNKGNFNLALDVGTGTGQVAIELSNKFEKVYGIDKLSGMLEYAAKKENITYKIGTAEKLPFKNNSIDLITVGTAFHWFDHNIFFNEVKRTLKFTGTLAVFGYSYPIIKNNNYANKILNTFLINKLEHYMNNKVSYMKNFYRNINFPFKKNDWYFTINNKNYDNINEKISIEKNITIKELESYLKTLSSYTNYINNNNNYLIDPIDDTMNEIMKIMDIKNKNESINVEWPVVLILNNDS